MIRADVRAEPAVDDGEVGRRGRRGRSRSGRGTTAASSPAGRSRAGCRGGPRARRKSAEVGRAVGAVQVADDELAGRSSTAARAASAASSGCPGAGLVVQGVASGGRARVGAARPPNADRRGATAGPGQPVRPAPRRRPLAEPEHQARRARRGPRPGGDTRAAARRSGRRASPRRPRSCRPRPGRSRRISAIEPRVGRCLSAWTLAISTRTPAAGAGLRRDGVRPRVRARPHGLDRRQTPSATASRRCRRASTATPPACAASAGSWKWVSRSARQSHRATSPAAGWIEAAKHQGRRPARPRVYAGTAGGPPVWRWSPNRLRYPVRAPGACPPASGWRALAGAGGTPTGPRSLRLPDGMPASPRASRIPALRVAALIRGPGVLPRTSARGPTSSGSRVPSDLPDEAGLAGLSARNSDCDRRPSAARPYQSRTSIGSEGLAGRSRPGPRRRRAGGPARRGWSPRRPGRPVGSEPLRITPATRRPRDRAASTVSSVWLSVPSPRRATITSGIVQRHGQVGDRRPLGQRAEQAADPLDDHHFGPAPPTRPGPRATRPDDLVAGRAGGPRRRAATGGASGSSIAGSARPVEADAAADRPRSTPRRPRDARRRPRESPPSPPA